MRKTKTISKVLFVLTNGLSWIYLATALYGTFSWVTGTNIYVDSYQAIIKYPFTEIAFLILDNNLAYLIFAFMLPMLSYTLFFWLLSNVFRIFYQDRLFTEHNIIHLKRFYKTNIILPLVLIIFSSFFFEIEKGIYMIAALHMFLGVMTLIISEIFEQGLNLQNEQDLYI